MTEWGPEGGLGDPRAGFGNLYKTFAAMAYQHAFRSLGDPDRAHDVVQQVFEAVWKQYDRDFATTSEQRARSLILVMTTRRVIDLYRRSDGVILVADYIESAVPSQHSATDSRDPLDRLLADYDLHFLMRTVQRVLTRTEYQIVWLTEHFGFSDAEVAEAMGTTVGTVRSHRSRAHKKVNLALPDPHRIGFDDKPDHAGQPDSEGGELQA